MAHDVVICYAPADRNTAEAACAALEAQGVRCWIAPRDVPAGCDQAEVTLEAIGSGRAMLRVVAPAPADDPIRPVREMERAAREGVLVVPFRPKNDTLGDQQQQEQLQQLAETVRQLLNPAAAAAAAAAAASPSAPPAPPPAPRLAALPMSGPRLTTAPPAVPPPPPAPSVPLSMLSLVEPDKAGEVGQLSQKSNWLAWRRKEGRPAWAKPWVVVGGAAAAAAVGCGAVGFLFGRAGRADAPRVAPTSVAAVPAHISSPKLPPARRAAPPAPARPAAPAGKSPANTPTPAPAAPAAPAGPTAVARADAVVSRTIRPQVEVVAVAAADTTGRMPVVPVQQFEDRMKAVHQAAESSRLAVRTVKTKKVIWRPTFGMQPTELTALAEFPDHFAFLQRLHAEFPDAGLADLELALVAAEKPAPGTKAPAPAVATPGKPKLRGVYGLIWSVGSDRTANAASGGAEQPPRRQRDWGGVFAELAQAMGRDVALNTLRLQTVEGAAGRPSLAPDAERERGWHRQRFAVLRLRGDAATESAVAAFVGKLGRTADFHNVNLVSSEDARSRRPGAKPRRGFEIELTVSCDEPALASARSQFATAAAARR